MIQGPWLVPWVWPHWLHTRFSVRQVFISWDPEGDLQWKILSLLWRLQSACCLEVANLSISCWLISQGLLGLGNSSWPESYLRFLLWVGDIYIFQRRDEAKRFYEEFSLLLRTRIPCLLSHVTNIFIPIRSHKTPRLNSPGDISPPFRWSHKIFPPTLTSDILAIHVWIFHPQ